MPTFTPLAEPKPPHKLVLAKRGPSLDPCISLPIAVTSLVAVGGRAMIAGRAYTGQSWLQQPIAVIG